jgi:quinol monooxygenase YgiN
MRKARNSVFTALIVRSGMQTGQAIQMKGHMMFAVTVTFRIHTGRMDDFLPKMTTNARTSRAVETGCQQFDICRDGDTIFLYELYDSRAAFDAHLASDHFKSFDAAVGPMIAEKHVVLFNEVIR